MGADIGLPLFSVSVSNPDFDALIDWVEAEFPKLADTVHTWRALRHVQIGDSDAMPAEVEAVRHAITAVGLNAVAPFDRIAQRLDWLSHDLAIAPLSISQPLLLLDGQFEPNVETIVVGPAFEWSSVRYLLGVLLSELHRLEGLDVDAAAAADQRGSFDLSASSLTHDALARTVDAIVWGDAGREFPRTARLPDRFELTEVQQFAKLQQLLAGHQPA